MIGSQFIGTTLYCKLNQWSPFGFEPTHDSSRAVPERGKSWIIAASPSHVWQDEQVDFGPAFTS
jgi:hypothetical protein